MSSATVHKPNLILRFGKPLSRFVYRHRRQIFVLVCMMIASVAIYTIYSGISSWSRSLKDDYAGIDPGSVVPKASGIFLDHYGKHPPSNLEFISKNQTHFFGKKAWKVVFKNADTKNLVCTFMWDGDNRILRGKSCA